MGWRKEGVLEKRTEAELGKPQAGRPTPLEPAGLGPSGLGSGSKNSRSHFGDLRIYVLLKVSYEKVRKRERKFGRKKEKKCIRREEKNE